jgi:GNAT superfamily N-acetyltransferase
MGPNVIIRKALNHDIGMLQNIRYLCWKRAYGHIYEEIEIERYFLGETHERRTWSASEFVRMETLAAEVGGVVCGYAKLGWNVGSHSELLSFYITPERWNHGIGSQLWNRVIELNRIAQVRTMNVWVLERARSSEFYIKQNCDLVNRGDYCIGERKEVALCYQWRP